MKYIYTEYKFWIRRVQHMWQQNQKLKKVEYSFLHLKTDTHCKLHNTHDCWPMKSH